MKLHTMSALTLTSLLLAGCQSADPASRSNRTQYRDIYASIQGSTNSITLTIGDGLYASADGGGDTLDNTATQTTDTKPEIAVGLGGGSAGTGGATPSSGIVGAALDKLMGILGGTTTAKLTPAEAQAITDCVGANCTDQ
jgi:hypothetical protein